LAASDWSMEGDPSVTAPASNEATEAPVGSADAGPAEGQQAASQADEGGENAGSAQQEELVPPEVNAEIIKQLLEFGFSPNRAVRAAYFSGNSTVEGALNWLEEHAEDNDLDDELVVPKESATSKKKKLTKEELEQRLKRARELRAKQEKEADLNREKMRIRMGREIAEARRIEEDQARMRLQIERQKEREEKERAMAAVKAKLEADRRERRRALGLPEELTEEEKAAEAEKERQKQEAEAKRFGGVVKPVTALTRLRDALVALKKDHEALAPVAFKTLAAYIGNVLRSPDEDKYRRINLENAAFQARRFTARLLGRLLLGPSLPLDRLHTPKRLARTPQGGS